MESFIFRLPGGSRKTRRAPARRQAPLAPSSKSTVTALYLISTSGTTPSALHTSPNLHSTSQAARSSSSRHARAGPPRQSASANAAQEGLGRTSAHTLRSRSRACQSLYLPFTAAAQSLCVAPCWFSLRTAGMMPSPGLGPHRQQGPVCLAERLTASSPRRCRTCTRNSAHVCGMKTEPCGCVFTRQPNLRHDGDRTLQAVASSGQLQRVASRCPSAAVLGSPAGGQL